MGVRILMLLLPATAFAGWGSFRGPGGTGIGSGDPPTAWNVATGENIAWQTDIPGLAHSSPIVHGRRVFLTTAISSDADPSLKVGLYGSGASPAEDATWTWQVLCNGYRHIGAYDLATGETIWWLRGGGDIPVPRPFVADGMVFISNAHGRMNPLYAVRTDAQGDITPTKGEAPPAGMAWWHSRAGSYIPTPIVYKGLLYVAGDRGVLTCFEASTGKQVYRRRIAQGRREAYSASPVAASGRLYLTSERGRVHVVQAGRDFRCLATNEMPEVCMATPAIDKGQLFLRTTKQLFCVAAGSQ